MIDAGYTYYGYAGGGVMPSGIPAGAGFGLSGAQAVTTDPTRQYVAGGSAWTSPTVPQVLPDVVDDVMRDFGPAVYEAMERSDPVVASHSAGLAIGIACAKIELLPAIRPKPKPAPRPAPPAPPAADGSAPPPPPAPPAMPADAEPELSPDEKTSQEVRDYCQRQLDRTKTETKAWLIQMLHGALVAGHKLAETVAEYADVGEDAGRLVLCDVKPRPRWAYRFVVNNFMDLLGVLSWDPELMRFVVVPDAKFVLATWLPRDCDPRGRSQLRAAFTWWNLKRLLPAVYYRFLKQHGSPIRLGFTGPDDNGMVPQIDPATGVELTDAPPVTPAYRLMQTLQWLEEGSVGAFKNGTIIQTEWPQGKGDPFLAAFDLCDRQMALALFHSTRVTMESEHGSKADSQTAQDEKGLLIHYGRGLARALLLQPLRPLVEANFGADAAERHMPEVLIEKDEHQDRAAIWTAAAALFPWLKPSQLDPFYAMIGLPPAAEGEDPMEFLRRTTSPAASETVPIDERGQLDKSAQAGKDAA